MNHALNTSTIKVHVFWSRQRNQVCLLFTSEHDDCITREHLWKSNDLYLIAIDLVAMFISQGLGHRDGHWKPNNGYGDGIHVHEVEEAGVRIGWRE